MIYSNNKEAIPESRSSPAAESRSFSKCGRTHTRTPPGKMQIKIVRKDFQECTYVQNDTQRGIPSLRKVAMY
jgi:hypothetical protein